MAKHVIILGAGISGLSAAWRLADNGISVAVLELQPRPGGLAGTVREEGYCLDFGPHSFFSEHREIIATVLPLFDKKLIPRKRTVKFYYKGKYLDYPLTPQGVLFQMGFLAGIKTSLSFLKSKLFFRHKPVPAGEDLTVEDWAIASFGEHLYRTFFKPYTEQFWKMPCSELSSRAIPTSTRMSFVNTLKVMLRQKTTGTGESLIERETLDTYYPDTGFGEIAERMAEMLEKKGVRILLEARAIGLTILPENRMRVSYAQAGRTKQAEGDCVISTMALPRLVRMLNPTAPPDVLSSVNKLQYRSLVVLGMLTEKQNILGCNYVYVLNRPYNRISEMNAFSPLTTPTGENILAVEIPAVANSTQWTADKQALFNMCIGSLAEDGFIQPGDVKRLFLAKAPNAYPVYTKDYAFHLARVMAHLEKHPSLFTIGRCGNFMYMDIDKCMKRAFDFVDINMEKFK